MLEFSYVLRIFENHKSFFFSLLGLLQLAIEQEERRKTAKLMYELGQKMYGKGMYGRAIEFYEGALTIIPKATLFGGEVIRVF